MVLHELVTNASKYGALSIPEGRVSVSWEYRNRDDATTWSDKSCGARRVVRRYQLHVKSGYGTSLICELIPHELGGTVDLAFSSEGVSCTIEIPHQSSWATSRERTTSSIRQPSNDRAQDR